MGDQSPNIEDISDYDIAGVMDTVHSTVLSKHEDTKLEKKKKRLFDAYQEDITVLFESMNDHYVKKELTKESIKVSYKGFWCNSNFSCFDSRPPSRRTGDN